MRRALASFLIEKAKSNSNLMFITGDLGFGVFDEFKKCYPAQYINVGIAEAAMVGIASGMAQDGLVPICYSIASFLMPRAYEQVKIFSGYNSSKIIYIGAGGGYSYGESGATHHSLDDLGLAAGVPNMNVYCPIGPKALLNSLEECFTSTNSSYVRIGKFGEIDLEENRYWDVSYEYSNVGLLSYGTVAKTVEAIAAEFKLDYLGITNLVPIDQRIFDFVKRKSIILLIEEHFEISPVYLVLLELANRLNFKVKRFGPKKVFEHVPLSHQSLIEKHITFNLMKQLPLILKSNKS